MAKKIRTIKFDKFIKSHKEREDLKMFGYVIVLMAIIVVAYGLAYLQEPDGFNESYCLGLLDDYHDVNYEYKDNGAQKIAVVRGDGTGVTVTIVFDGNAVKQCSLNTMNVDLGIEYVNDYSCNGMSIKYTDASDMIAVEYATPAFVQRQIVFFNPDYSESVELFRSEITEQLAKNTCV